MAVALYIVDAFANVRFSGNPAAVCLLRDKPDEGWMQNVAMEMNLSETAFLSQRGTAPEEGFDLRWFTPSAEVDLCGHATLASAHVLWTTGVLARHKAAIFHTQSGLLTATTDDGWIELDFPSILAKAVPYPPNLRSALAVEATWFGWTGMDYLIELGNEREVLEVKPNFVALAEVETRGTIVTARAEKNRNADFVSRFFAPRYGINEDPVTGSAHCSLGPYWGAKLSKDELIGHQMSDRGGEVVVSLDGKRVRLSGKAVTTMSGEFL